MTQAEIQALMDSAACFCSVTLNPAEQAKLQLLAEILAASSSGGGTPSLPFNSVQFNNAGAFGGSADLTFDDATNVLALTGTLNSTTVLLGNGALATPSLSFASETNLGIYRVGALRIGFVTNGNLRGEFNNAIFELKAAIPLSFNSSTFLRGDDAANEIAQRNGAGAQFYKLYRTFTNSTNYERLSLGSAAGQMVIAAETQGTGTDNIDLTLTSAGTGIVNITQGIIRYVAGFTVAALPAAGLAGRRAYVTDGLGAAWGVAIAGGGAQTVPVFDNGAAWIAG